MSIIKIQGNVSGTGTLTIAAPNTNSDFTMNLPASNGTVPILGSATNNGVVFIDGSGQMTSGSALTFNGTNFATTGSVTSAGSSNSGNLAFTGTGNRITGDFSNATHANRVAFQSSTTNGATSPFIIPNGTNTIASIVVANASDPTNSSFGQLAVSGTTDVRVLSGQLGTGSYLPLTFYTGGSERMRVDTSGNVGIGATSPARKLDVRNTSADYQLHLGDSASTTLGYELGRENTGGLFKFYGNQTGATGYIFSGVDGERMRIDTSGNVGIGTSSPNGNLAVQQASSTTGGPVISLWNSNANAGNTCGYLKFYSNTSVRAQIHSVIDSGAPYYGNLIFSTGETTLNERARIASTGQMSTTNGAGTVALAYDCRAWVSFNGQGTVAIRASGNVSSITDIGTGTYRVNFSTAMPDTSYSVNVNATWYAGTTAATTANVNGDSGSQPTTSAYGIRTFVSVDGSTYDPLFVYSSVFR